MTYKASDRRRKTENGTAVAIVYTRHRVHYVVGCLIKIREINSKIYSVDIPVCDVLRGGGQLGS